MDFRFVRKSISDLAEDFRFGREGISELPAELDLEEKAFLSYLVGNVYLHV